MISSDTDILFPAYQIKKYAEFFKKHGANVTYYELKSGGFGHAGGLYSIFQASDVVKKFLENK